MTLRTLLIERPQVLMDLGPFAFDAWHRGLSVPVVGKFDGGRRRIY